MDASLRVGVDLGGTKIEAVVVRTGGGAPEVLAGIRRPTERERGYRHIVDAVAAIVTDVTREAGFHRVPPVGIGMPGSWTRRGEQRVVKNSNTTCLNGEPFFDDVRAALDADVAFANDANCFALAEATWGAAKDARVVFGVILGTGVGGGVVLRGDDGRARVWDGRQGIAGEWGHVCLEPASGPACYCGRRGCVETYLSGPALEAAYEQRTGTRRALAEIDARASGGDAVAAAFLTERMDIFGRALATVLDVLDPDVVVLGGGASKMNRWYDEGTRAAARWLFSDGFDTPVVRHALGDSAGVLGAALL